MLCSFRPVSYPENHYSLSPAGGDRMLPYRNPSASFSSPSSGLVGLSTIGPPGITPGPFVRYKPSPDRCVCICGLFVLWALLWSWLNMSDVTHNNCFVCWRQMISVDNIGWIMCRHVWTHCVPEERSVVWAALPDSAEVDNISLNLRNVFYSTAIRMQHRNWKSPLLSTFWDILGFNFSVCVILIFCVQCVLVYPIVWKDLIYPKM